MTSFPTSLYTASHVSDGVDYPQATHVNTLQDEIAAIETALAVNFGGTPATGQTLRWDGASWSPVNDQYPMEARLTLETAVAVSTTDQAAKTTLYLTKYKGDQIAVYDGASAWSVIALGADLSITLASLTAGLPYDVYVYSNAGTLTLELTAWTNTTTRATALTTQNGVYVKTGATTRRYLGTICIVATGQCEDSFTSRMVWNYYNQVPRAMTRINVTAHAYATGTWRAWNNDAPNSQVQFVLGEAVNITGVYRANNTVAGGGVAFSNATTGPGGTKGEQFNNAADAASSDAFSFTPGYNIWVAVEYGGGSFDTERISMTMTVLG